MRYTVAAALTNGIVALTPKSILASFGTICTVANSSTVALFNSFKIREIEIWAPGLPNYGTSVIQPSTVTVEWESAVNSISSTLTFSDTSNNVSAPAHVRCSPPRGSTASFWSATTSSTLVTIGAPVGAVVDVECDLVMDADNTDIDTTSIASGTLGNVYYLALDGPTSALVRPIPIYAYTA